MNQNEVCSCLWDFEIDQILVRDHLCFVHGSIATTERMAWELEVYPLRVARYSDGELMQCMLRIVSRPGPLTEQDKQEISVIDRVIAYREKLRARLDVQIELVRTQAQMN